MMKRAYATLAALACLSPAFAAQVQSPPEAVAAGFTQEMLGGRIVLGLNWFVTPGAYVTQNADGSVTIAGSDGWQWNGQLSTVKKPSGKATMCDGSAFGGGGYFEATLSVQGKPAGWYQGANGWPSFWGNAVESMYGGGNIVHNIETDFMELMQTDGSFGSGMHNWFQGNNAVNTVSIGGDGTAHTAGTNWSQVHKVGWLWQPGKGTQTFLDGRVVSSQALGAGTPFSQLDQEHLQLYLGSGKENPMTVYSVYAWQNPKTANNVCQSGTSGNVNALATPAPTIGSDVTTDVPVTTAADNQLDSLLAAVYARQKSPNSVAARQGYVEPLQAPQPVSTNSSFHNHGTASSGTSTTSTTVPAIELPQADNLFRAQQATSIAVQEAQQAIDSTDDKDTEEFLAAEKHAKSLLERSAAAIDKARKLLDQ